MQNQKQKKNASAYKKLPLFWQLVYRMEKLKYIILSLLQKANKLFIYYYSPTLHNSFSKINIFLTCNFK